MRILRQLTRKKNAFLRGIKFNSINYRYRNKPTRKAFDPVAVRHVLLLRLDDKVGDMVVTTGCAGILAERGYQVSVLTGPIRYEVLIGSELIQQVYLYRPCMSLNTLRTVGFDAVIDFDDVTNYERFKLFVDLWTTSVVGFNKDQCKLYDHSIAFLDNSSHISQRYRQVVKPFGIVDNHPCHHHLPNCRHEWEKVARSLSQAEEVELRTTINPFTASENKDFYRHQVATLVERLHVLLYRVCIVMMGRSEKIRQLELDMALYIADSTISSAAGVIRSCDLVIASDTSITHIARAFDKLVVAVYNKRKLKDTGLPGYHIWASGYNEAEQIVCEEASVADMTTELVWPVIKEQAGRLAAVRSWFKSEYKRGPLTALFVSVLPLALY